MRGKNMKKKLLIGGSLILLIAIIAIAIVMTVDNNNPSDSEIGDTYSQNIEILNDRYPTDVVIYGESIIFRDELNYRMIDEITEENLATELSAQVLIINDLSGNIEIPDGAYNIILKKMADGNMDYYYLGTTKVDMFNKYNLWNKDLEKGDLAIGVAKYNKVVTNFSGVWTEYDANILADNKEGLGSTLVNQIARCIKSNN